MYIVHYTSLGQKWVESQKKKFFRNCYVFITLLRDYCVFITLLMDYCVFIPFHGNCCFHNYLRKYHVSLLSAHVCTAYMVSDKQTRQGRAQDAIIHASSAIFNGGMSSLVGVVVLIFTESYIFQSFFKITLLVVGFGMLHAVLLIPVVLSFIGPGTYIQLDEGSKDTSYSISRRSSATTPSTKEKDAAKDGGSKFTAIQHDKHDSYGYKNKAFEADAHLGYLRD